MRGQRGRFMLSARYWGEMYSRVDKGAFPRSRWKGVTRTPQSSGGLPHRQQGRRGGPSPPLLWLPSQDAVCLWYVTVE